jgi:hypothetical protein
MRSLQMTTSEESPLERLLRDATPRLNPVERDRVILECGRRMAMRRQLGTGIASSVATAACMLALVTLGRPSTVFPDTKIDRAEGVAAAPKGEIRQEPFRVPSDHPIEKSLPSDVWNARLDPSLIVPLDKPAYSSAKPTHVPVDHRIPSGKILKATDRDYSVWLGSI